MYKSLPLDISEAPGEGQLGRTKSKKLSKIISVTANFKDVQGKIPENTVKGAIVRDKETGKGGGVESALGIS